MKTSKNLWQKIISPLARLFRPKAGESYAPGTSKPPDPRGQSAGRLRLLEQTLGYTFTNERLLYKALTHSSYANEKTRHGLRHNERMEFLGDAVLGLVLSDCLFSRFPDRREGEMSLMKSWLVSESSLSTVAKSIELGNYLFLGSGEDAAGGRARSALLADALEALIGSVYLDGGFTPASRLVLKLFAARLETVDEDKEQINYKNALQMLMHSRGRGDPEYVLTAAKGPDHMKTFETEVRIDGSPLGRGTGPTKKEAELNAAKEALEALQRK